MTADRNDDLAVEDELLRLQREKRCDEFRKVARERLPGFRLNHDRAAGAEDDRAEPVPLRLEEPFVAGRNPVDALRLHRRKRRLDRKIELRETRPGRLRGRSRWLCAHAEARFAGFFFGAGVSKTFDRSNLFLPTTGFQRSPTFATRCRMLSMRKSSTRTPCSTSSHVTGVETPANGVGRTE